MAKRTSAKAASALSTHTKSKTSTSGWTTPKGDSVRSLTRDATGQVIRHYDEALRKLQKH
jgi:hypothetical protein